MTDALLIAYHLGALHPVEKVLTLVLAFGPFAVLGVVVVLRNRADAAEEAAATTATAEAAVVGEEDQRER